MPPDLNLKYDRSIWCPLFRRAKRPWASVHLSIRASAVYSWQCFQKFFSGVFDVSSAIFQMGFRTHWFLITPFWCVLCECDWPCSPLWYLEGGFVCCAHTHVVSAWWSHSIWATQNSQGLKNVSDVPHVWTYVCLTLQLMSLNLMLSSRVVTHNFVWMQCLPLGLKDPPNYNTK